MRHLDSVVSVHEGVDARFRKNDINGLVARKDDLGIQYQKS